MAVNTRIITTEFAYLRPETLAEALQLLAEKQGMRIYSGGTDIMIKLKCNEQFGLEYLLDINHIPGLEHLEQRADGALHIGPLVKLSRLEQDAVVKASYPMLQTALHLMAAISIRNMGTMAGNLCNASPAADTALPAICYGAQLTLQSLRGSRVVAAEDFFTGPGATVMAKDEMLVDIALPLPAAHTGASFIKKTRVRPDIAKLSIGVVLTRDGDKIGACRVAMGAVAPVPLFMPQIGDLLAGRKFSDELVETTAAAIAAAIKPIDDMRSTAEYRSATAEIIAADALREAWVNAGGEL
jgi:carbon-monoxide dehydrogenase medium subunit